MKSSSSYSTATATASCLSQMAGLKQMGAVRPYTRNSKGGKAIRLFASQAARAGHQWVNIGGNLAAATAASRRVWQFLSAWSGRRDGRPVAKKRRY